jgi:RNA polymerase sigma factor (sigma-70 family)
MRKTMSTRRYEESEPQRPSLNEKAVRAAFVRYRGGDDEAGKELLTSLFKVRKSWARSLQWYKDVSWDLAQDAVLDTILNIHERARAKQERKLVLPRRGLRKFIYRLVRQRLWSLRRSAHETEEKRRDEEAKKGEAASPFLPRIVHVSEIPETVEAVPVTKSALEGLLLKNFLKLPTRKRAMALFHFEGISYAEIARMTGTTERAARVHVSNLLATLRKCAQVENAKDDPNEKAVRRAQ